MLEWLRLEGGLTPTLRYAGSPRRGYSLAARRRHRDGRRRRSAALDDLLRTGFGKYLATEINMQTPMFQVVGGTDGIVRRRWRARSDTITLGARVQAIEQPTGRVRVRYRRPTATPRQIEGAFCISTLPLTVLRDVRLDASPELRAAIAAINYSSAGKIGLQFSRRFWEEDDGIFGGITRTDQEITQILYPSTGYLSRKGVLVGYYQTGAAAGRWAIWRPPNDCSARSSRER